jgi:hypothetical protein
VGAQESRVFRDRLINEGDRDYFNGLLRDMIAKHMATDLLVSEFKELIYGDYLTREDKVSHCPWGDVERALWMATDLWDMPCAVCGVCVRCTARWRPPP